jgi:radical SAM superfamily enzyme YgiQ (UPF0313 family)
VPSLYEVAYRKMETIEAVTAKDGAPMPGTQTHHPRVGQGVLSQEFVVPIHRHCADRAMLEVLRGCVRGCRFCQRAFSTGRSAKRSTLPSTRTARPVREHRAR